MPESNYRLGIRSAVRGTWLGLFTPEDFFEVMDGVVRFNIRMAFHEGAKECGIAPAEFTAAERAALNAAIQNELSFIFNFGLAIEAGSKANGGKLGVQFKRADAWILRYKDVKNRARLMACGNKLLQWILGPTEHCPSCLKLSGQVRRANFWQEKGVHPRDPRNPNLICEGWRCQCQLVPTTERSSRGPLPRLP